MISVEEYRVPLFSVVVEATTPEVGTTAHAQVSSAYFHGAPNVGARVHWKATWTTSAEYGSESEEAIKSVSILTPRSVRASTLTTKT